ncbi:nickel pincer cofactor biosynthesis protein LarB [bacterium]|nr:MAG: nickel pincer cofactor biosynthesis protein LarB [bacterium]
MNPKEVAELLHRVKSGEASVDDALEKLRDLPFADLGYAKVDHHRALRNGYPEIVFGMGKTVAQIVGIMGEITRRGQGALVTRVEAEVGAALTTELPELVYDPVARTGLLASEPAPPNSTLPICVVTAGTSDLPVAAEAAVTASALGNEVTRLTDVGVAGIHRLLAQRHVLDAAGAIVVVAGMEGALASVVGGLVNVPVVAVPTSIGYGASFEGITPLLAMLNSCASGVTVVNIDNGFGGAYAACLMVRGR